MLVIQLLILGALLVAAPIIIGTLFRKVNNGGISLSFFWVSGQILLWAGFLVICVPLILLGKSFTMACNLFNGYTVLLLLLAICSCLWKYFTGKRAVGIIKGFEESSKKSSKLLWTIFGVLLLVQLVLSVVLSYEEGDDAFYIAISTITQDADTMYYKLPYTGGSTGLDARHGLAPFPVWIAYLGKMSGMAAVSVAQVVLSVTMIGLAYAIYYLMAVRLCDKDRSKVPFFMILVALLVMFGGYSLYTVENFLLVRASQGKAVIANIVLPFLLYLFMLLLEKLQKQEKVSLGFWILMAISTMAGCLCSTQGTILTCIMVGITGLCVAVSYRNLKVLFWMAATCIVPVVMAFLYFVVR